MSEYETSKASGGPNFEVRWDRHRGIFLVRENGRLLYRTKALVLELASFHYTEGHGYLIGRHTGQIPIDSEVSRATEIIMSSVPDRGYTTRAGDEVDGNIYPRVLLRTVDGFPEFHAVE